MFAEERTNQIAQMYRDILDREPDEEGLHEWVKGGQPLDKVREGIANSPESRARLVAQISREVLGHEADPEALQGWVNSSKAIDEVRAEIAGSPVAWTRRWGR
jgi:hypothetical protein